jgi:hypothetical protein
MKTSGLGDAEKLFRARKFSAVIRALEPEVFRYRESFDFYLILGLSCLRSGELGGASSYLERARQLNADDIRPLLGLAAIKLTRAHVEEALKLWLEVLDVDPGNRVAKRGIGVIRRSFDPGSLRDFVESSGVLSLYPPMPPRIRPLFLLIAFLSLAILGCLGYLGFRIFTPTTAPPRPGIGEMEIPAGLSGVVEAPASGAKIVLNERQVRQAFEDAKRNLLRYRDNLAVVEINRILISNASLPVKERTRILKSFVATPSFASFRDGYAYSQVSKAPSLYDGAFVLWKGEVANLDVGKDEIRFKFLVGYEKRKELQGVVPVTLDFSAVLQNGIPLELLARVVAEEDLFTLSGISLHRLSP